MNYLDIIKNPPLLRQMTQQEGEYLTYEQQIVRLKALMRPKVSGHPYTPISEIPF